MNTFFSFFQTPFYKGLFFITFFSAFALSESKKSDRPILPEVNVYGLLNGQQVEYITIKNLYKQIPVYNIPAHRDGRPRDTSVAINLISPLSDTPLLSITPARSIALPHDGRKEIPKSEVEYDGVKYIPLIFTFAKGMPLTFLIEADAVITCYKQPLNLEWRLAIRELESLVISGYETDGQRKNLSPIPDEKKLETNLKTNELKACTNPQICEESIKST